MSIKIAIMGFRHVHIFDLYKRAKESPDFDVVAACEEDPQRRKELLETGQADITFDNYQKMLDSIECDAIAVGDYFAKRGGIILEALKHGKHVISDKPICTSLEELDQIQSESSKRGLVVGCMLDVRDHGNFQRARELVRNGEIGEVHGVSIGGQHPLMLGSRPSWYFEEGKHGGSINDIGVHAFDIIPWITGLDCVEVTAARSWNAFAKEFPHFHDAGQFMVRLSNDGGMLGDVSYFMPDTQGYSLEQYWRMVLFGRDGVIETSYNMAGVKLARNGKDKPEMIPPTEGTPGGYLKSFAREVNGETEGLSLSSAEVFKVSRVSLMVQEAGINNRTHVALK